MSWWAEKIGSQGSGSYHHEERVPKRWAPPPSPSPSNALDAPPVRRALQSQQQNDTCPACNSGNYLAAQGRTYKRCYDCGYPIEQSGTGVGSVKADGPSKKAVQVQGGGFNPQQIIGRVE